MVMPRELQRNYHDLIEYTKNSGKPVYILHYREPDAILISIKTWEEICSIVKQKKRLESLTSICRQCRQMLEFSTPWPKPESKPSPDIFDIIPKL